MEFGEKIQKLRNEKKWTQEQLAEKLYVSRTAVSKWESGKGYPNIDSLKDIAKLFNKTIDELLDYRKEVLGEIVLEEEYSLEGIAKEGKARSKEEALLIKKFDKATEIYTLQKKKQWNWKKNLFWFLVEPSYSSQLEDFVENGVYS